MHRLASFPAPAHRFAEWNLTPRVSPRGRADNRASCATAWAGELPLSRATARGREDSRALRIAGRDARRFPR
eukprot:2912303-Pyramimonas_sp.AAC.1